jgi:adenosyl cobinamide kinase/adenosyl cobinamide phosphate guanylyltransferase
MEHAHHTHLGTTRVGGDIWLSRHERLEHIAVIGASGSGKSTFAEYLVAQDMARGDGVLLIDPNGPLAEAALQFVPPHRHNHVCYLNVPDLDFPVGMNVLDDVHPDKRAVLVDALVSAMRSIWRESWGPRMEQILRHSARALIEIPNASVILLPRLLTDDAYRKSVTGRISDPFTRAFFADRFEAWRNEYRYVAIDPVLNKIEAFLAFPHVRNILGQGRSTLHLDLAMARSRIVIVNLSKSHVSETAAHLTGAFLIGQLLSKMTLGLDRDFHVIIDEAHNFGSLSLLLREARKFRVSVTAITQYLDGLDVETRAAIRGTTRTQAYFRLGGDDATLVAPGLDREFQQFNRHSLLHLDRGAAFIQRPGCDASEIVVPPPRRDVGNPAAVIKQSRLHYGRDRTLVENNILRVLGFEASH